MIKQPLVIGPQGQIQQLQSGDSVVASSVGSQFDAVNGDVVMHLPGTVVYISSSGTVQSALANSYNTVRAVAMASGTIASGAVGVYQIDGLASGFNNLTPNTTYFLSPTSAGSITATVPTTNGQWVLSVGVAYSPTQINVAFGTPIQL
jgi:hypothetical protein